MKKMIITVAMLATISLDCGAQQPTTLSMRQCIDLAVEHNYGMQAARKGVERARTMQGTAWDIDKTELSLSQDPTSGGSPDNALTVTQSIDFPTVYVARRRLLKAETKAEGSRVGVVASQLSADVASAYCSVQYAAERLRLTLRQDSVLRRLADTVRKRYEAGEMRQLDVLSVDRLVKDSEMEIEGRRNDYAVAIEKLRSLVNVPYEFGVGQNAFTLLELSAAGDFNYAATAESEYAADRLAVADRNVALEKNGFMPSLSLSLRNQMVISSWNPYDADRSRFKGGNFMGFEVGVSVPLFFGAERARVKAAQKSREQLRLEISDERNKLTQEYNALRSNSIEAHRRYESLDASLNGDVAEMRRLAVLECENGEMSLLESVSVLQQIADVEMRRAAAIDEYNQTVVQMSRYGVR